MLSGNTLDDILDELPAGFLRFSDDGLLLQTNLTFREMLGYSEEEIQGLHVEKLLSVPSRIFYQTHIFPLLKVEGKIDEVYISALHKNGSAIPVLMSGRRRARDGVQVSECLCLPIEKRNLYEDEILNARRIAESAKDEAEQLHLSLQQRNRDLEDLRASLELRVEERTVDLAKLVEELQAFNYSIAHNLRAPLRAILSTASLLDSELHEHLSEEQLFLIRRQSHNAKMLSSLIEDLLQLSRLVVQPLEKQSVDLSSLAEAAFKRAAAGNPEIQFDIQVSQGVVALVDHRMATRLLDCLVSNAVKYSPNGGILSFGGRRDGDEITCWIKDEGIGMNPAYINRIFAPFERLHLDAEFRGNGIGLAIADRIVRRHGGRVWAVSNLGEGSTFYFTLESQPLVADNRVTLDRITAE